MVPDQLHLVHYRPAGVFVRREARKPRDGERRGARRHCRGATQHHRRPDALLAQSDRADVQRRDVRRRAPRDAYGDALLLGREAQVLQAHRRGDRPRELLRAEEERQGSSRDRAQGAPSLLARPRRARRCVRSILLFAPFSLFAHNSFVYPLFFVDSVSLRSISPGSQSLCGRAGR